MDFEDIKRSANATFESQQNYEGLLERFHVLFQRAKDEPDHPSLRCSWRAEDADKLPQTVSGLIPLTEDQILKLRQENPMQGRELAARIAEGLKPIIFVEVIYDSDKDGEQLRAETQITYATTLEDGSINPEAYPEPYYFGQEIIYADPHVPYPPQFTDEGKKKSMGNALDIVEQSVRLLD